MNHLDAFLIDRVCQPIANRLEPWCSPFQIARWASYFGTASFVAAYSHMLLVDHADYIAMIGLPLWLFGSVCLHFELDEIERRCRRIGTANPERLQHCGLRLSAVAMFLLTCALVRYPPTPVWWNAAWPFGWFAWLISFYFRACQMPPPRPRRARVPAGAALGGAA